MKKGFTLIELLVAITILTILATVAVLVVNPAEYLKQSRDTKRIGDIKTIDDAISTSLANSPNMALGTATVVYVSIPDTATNCPTLAVTLPTLPTGWSYYCSAVANYRKTNGTGWVPINFDALSTKSPMATLPIDQTNDVSKGLYYTYIPGGSYALSATLESDKYLKQSASNDGGYDPARFEQGSDPKLLAKAEGLMGYWSFEEGSGAAVNDSSGYSNNGTWNIASQYASGKVGSYAGQFPGQPSASVSVSSAVPVTSNNTITVAQWAKIGAIKDRLVNRGWCSSMGWLSHVTLGFGVNDSTGCAVQYWVSYGSLNSGQWYYLVGVFDGSKVYSYVNGNLMNQRNAPGVNLNINNYGVTLMENSDGLLDDVRIYNRALSATEVKNMYSATK
jgi:prepilin-type N-terminal cleavage/methylation domain-containing protein